MPQHYFIAPFLPESYYLVARTWLTAVKHPLELDVCDLVACAQVEDSDVVAFIDAYELAQWVRENEDGRPNLLSHVTFHKYFDSIANDRGDGTEPLLRPVPETRDMYQIQQWPQIADAGVIYKPRTYIHNLWPARLGQGKKDARAALLVLFHAMTTDTPERAEQPVTRGVTLRQIRAQAPRLLPQFGPTDKIGTCLRELEELGLITEVDHGPHNTTYRLNLPAFDRAFDIKLDEVAAICGLDPVEDRAWVELIAAFLEAQLRPAERARDVWKQLGKYRQWELESEEDAQKVTALVKRRSGRKSPSIKRAMRDYREQKGDEASWIKGRAFVLALHPSGFAHASGVEMPALGGAYDHLQATQLVLSVERGPGVSELETARLLSGSRIAIWQAPHTIEITGNLRVSQVMAGAQTILDCNLLHTALNYARPFTVMLFGQETNASLQLTGRFRVRRTRSK